MIPDHLAATTVRREGYAVLEGQLGAADLESLRVALEALGDPMDRRGGIRGVLETSPVLGSLARQGRPAELARAVLGPDARPVKATLFDKRPDANWKVPWHQDLTIAIRERRDLPGFGPWTVKDGIPHVQPPAEILESLLAVRIHLDAATPDNGALRVVPGSHTAGRLSKPAADLLRATHGEVACPVEAGGILLMFPLLLHASSPSEQPTHRRVLHIEYAGGELPGGLAWR